MPEPRQPLLINTDGKFITVFLKNTSILNSKMQNGKVVIFFIRSHDRD